MCRSRCHHQFCFFVYPCTGDNHPGDRIGQCYFSRLRGGSAASAASAAVTAASAALIPVGQVSCTISGRGINHIGPGHIYIYRIVWFPDTAESIYIEASCVNTAVSASFRAGVPYVSGSFYIGRAAGNHAADGHIPGVIFQVKITGTGTQPSSVGDQPTVS